MPAAGLTNQSGTHQEGSTNHVLRAENLHRWLGQDEGRVHVLKGIDLSLYPGKVYAAVGPSGCGKSTMLYLLGLLDQPDDGAIWLGKEHLSDASEEARTRARNAHIGFVFQFHYLLIEFTAVENIMLPMRRLGQMGEKEMRDRAMQLLDEVGLANKANRYANHLSGGEQQRLAIARALANDPTVILADEPTGNLDAKNSRTVFDMLRRFAYEKNKATLMVTHNAQLAKACDHTLHMQDGLFLSDGDLAREREKQIFLEFE